MILDTFLWPKSAQYVVSISFIDFLRLRIISYNIAPNTAGFSDTLTRQIQIH